MLPQMTMKEQAKTAVKQLIEKYERVKSQERAKEYSEQTTNKDFIMPLFEALGWDVYNKKTDDEVTAEESVSKKRVDFAFRLNGMAKLFIECKALKVDLEQEKWAEQATNYAHIKGVVWAVLTNFESIKIFNSQLKSESRIIRPILEMNYADFLTRFDDLWLLSRESLETGFIDKIAEGRGQKFKKVPVGEQLLLDLTTWRARLSKDILERNKSKNLTEDDLDESVQRILDRLIFIRKCEDSELEQPNLLLSKVREWEGNPRGFLAKHIFGVFSQFDEIYDSRLFLPHLCDDLDISNQVISEVINGLYHTKDRAIQYDFSAIDADVLGSVYEQYLGHILKKTAKRATVTEKHAHRKEQGIYYTPTYIVDYIVKNTLGELLKTKSQKEAEKIRVLDPACGSGSFLIKTFDVFDKYFKKAAGSQQELEFARRSKILTENIYGVDLDPKAVEIAQLNLLLKTAEKKERLPMLQNNIKCGNSLIDDPAVAGEARAFKWDSQFQKIMKQEGGFDVVIGNPPYVRQEELTPIKGYLQQNYQTYNGTADLFVYFFERELKILKEGGYFGMIVSNKWLKAGYGAPLRKFLNKFWIEQFIDFGDLPVFEDATTYPCIIIIRKIGKPNPKIKVCPVKTLQFDGLENYVKKHSFIYDQKKLGETGWNFKNTGTTAILEKIKQTTAPLKEYVGNEVYRGVLTGLNEAFVIDEKTKNELIARDKKSSEIIKPFLTGTEVRRYGIESKNKYLIFTRRGVKIENYPEILKYLEQFRARLTPKKYSTQALGRKPGDYAWYEIQDVIAYHKEFDKPKLVYGVITVGPRFTLDFKGYYANNANFFIPTADKKLLAILNSKLGWFLISNICTEIRGGYQLIWKYFSDIPIAKQKSPEVEKLADKMLRLNEKLLEIGDKKTDERARVEEEIKRTDAEIDELVYKLYGITDEEKKIIAESLK